MTTLVFPESSEDWSLAFNNGLARGEFCNDPNKHEFWAHHELLASELQDGAIVADWFRQQNIRKYVRIPRQEEIES